MAANRLLTYSNQTEENIVYQSLLDVNIPKINPTDMPLCKSIIDDLFPNESLEEKNYNWLQEAFERKCNEKTYEPIEKQYRKLIEIYEMSGHRQGVMLIGNPYTGKSFILKTLIDAIKTKNQLENHEMDFGTV